MERWEIEVGNAATVTELVHYWGTQRGAVRAAMRRWRARTPLERVLVLRRPDCAAMRVFKEEE